MKFTMPSENGVLYNKFFDTYTEAKNYFNDDNIFPVVGLEEWVKIPKEYKGFKDGKPYCLYMADTGTVYGEVFIVYDI